MHADYCYYCYCYYLKLLPMKDEMCVTMNRLVMDAQEVCVYHCGL